MPYELRLPGAAPRRFETEAEAVAAASAAIRANADAVPEVVDLLTGKPCAPAATAEAREDLAGKVGF